MNYKVMLLSHKATRVVGWIAIPLMMRFARDERRWIRATALLVTVTALLPLVFLGLLFWALFVVPIGIYEAM